jgi:hypothetical protein
LFQRRENRKPKELEDKTYVFIANGLLNQCRK